MESQIVQNVNAILLDNRRGPCGHDRMGLVYWTRAPTCGYAEGTLLPGNCMPIVEDYDAIAKRLRELQMSTAPKDADQISSLEKWRNAARETAQAYVIGRRRITATGPLLPRRPQPTD